MKKRTTRKGKTENSQESTHARIRREIPVLMKNRSEITCNTLRVLLEMRLGVKLRMDYLVGNMMGMKGYLIDCENYLIIKVL